MASYGGFNADEDFGMPGYQNGVDGPADGDHGGRQHPGNQAGPEHGGGEGADEGRGGGASGEGHDTAVFVGNLQWWTTDVELETLCSEYGTVASIRFIEDKACGKSRGMAVVEFGDTEAAARCVSGLGGKDINGRPCRVNFQSQRGGPGGGGREAGRGMGPAGGRGMGLPGRGGGGGAGRGMGVPGRGGGPGRGGLMGPYDDFAGPNPMAMGEMMGMPGFMGVPGAMMGMGMNPMEMMMMSQMGGGMPGMMPFGAMGPAAGMGFKPPPPPGPPPKKE